MKNFIELTQSDGQKIIINISCIQSVLPGKDLTTIGFVSGWLKGIEVQESFETVQKMLGFTPVVEKKSTSKVSRGLIVR